MGLKDRLEEDRASEGRADSGSVTHWRRRLLAEINLEDLTRLTLAQRRVRLEKVVGHRTPVHRLGPQCVQFMAGCARMSRLDLVETHPEELARPAQHAREPLHLGHTTAPLVEGRRNLRRRIAFRDWRPGGLVGRAGRSSS